MLDALKFFIDFILHIDRHLFEIVTRYDTWTYLILFIIVFAETGLVVTPLLPGDSLLFAAGALASPPGEALNIGYLIIVLFIAVFAGDNTNYFIGKYVGPKVFEKNYRFLKREYLEQTREFYIKHGGKAIVMARFVPIVRTFAPFVAGVGTMTYKRFIGFSLLGSLIWINVCLWAGYLFGKLPFVKENFSIVVLIIIAISVVPVIVGILRSRMKK